MSCCNNGDYVTEAIGSILNQTVAGFEVIVLDDGSTDASAEVIRSFSDKRIV